MNREMKVILSVGSSMIICLGCLTCLGGSSLIVYWALQPIPTQNATAALPPNPDQPPQADSPTPEGTPFGSGTPLPEGTVLDLSESAPPAALETLQNLIAADPPAGDLVEQAERLAGITGIPRVISETAAPVPVGATASFFVSNSDTDDTATVTAAQRYATPHVYFWVDERVTARDSDIRIVVDTFENDIYPTDRDFFGTEWTPGIDGDPHLYILWAEGLGSNVAGYYSSADEVSRKAHPFSNQHEMFYMNAEGMSLTDDYVMTVLAHEFQHMIHWYGDRNEETWVNEGFSELAVLLNGFDLGGADWVYVNQTDLQLNTWSDINDSDSSAHYGGSFMFMNYFLGRFGAEATKALVRDSANGLVGIDEIFQQLNLRDPSGKRLLTAEDVMTDFGAALLVQDASLEDGRFGFSEYPDAPELGDINKIKSCPSKKQSKTVSQFGFDYYSMGCNTAFTIQFAGQTTQKVLPVEAPEGKYYVWSNRGDESDMTLTRAFELPEGGAATLEFDMWYDIEEDYDYAYLLASVDDGNTWKMLETTLGTDSNPQGSNFGWGWTGASAAVSETGWATETVDLSAYTGKKVLLRFEYVTDGALTMEGLLIDNIRIPEIGYTTDFEDGLDGWEARGFVRLQNIIPQMYRVLVVRLGAEISVEELSLDERMFGSVSITPKQDEEIFLIVLGTARYTNQKAPYQFIVLS